MFSKHKPVVLLAIAMLAALLTWPVSAVDNWDQQSFLTASDPGPGDNLGAAVAIDGNTMVVGAPEQDIDPQASVGAAYVFEWDGSMWNQVAKLTQSSAGEAPGFDRFGIAVAIQNDVIYVGAQEFDPLLDDVSRPDTGGVYVFVKPSGGWTDATEDLVLLPDVPEDFAFFGRSIDIDGTRLVVGSPSYPQTPEGGGDPVNQAGAVYVFEGSGVEWTQTAQLVRPTPSTGAYFGIDVDVLGDTLLIGAAD
ncbi:MAG: hypothetical protein GYB68_16110, partial [Chloroflexi bacterium]|nr:hypothetical protein [Chloroflexota bacterium]